MDKIDKLIEVLNIPKKGEMYQTRWGNKTHEGLRATIESILKEK